MKVKNSAIGLQLLLLLAFQAPARAAVSMLVDDFNNAKTVNKLGGNTGCWSCNPQDINQYCDATFVTDQRIGAEGYALRLDYNQTTPNDYIAGFPKLAFNGYFSLLQMKKLTKMKYLVINIKGDESLGYTHSITIQLKNSKQSGSYKLEGISGDWQRFVIPLNRFNGITEWYYMKELVIVFDEKTTRRTGTVYIDNVSFTDSPFPRSASAQYLKHAIKGPQPEIDGDDNDWQNSSFFDITAEDDLQSGSIYDPKLSYATVAFQWDNDYLYLFANVTDPELVCSKAGSDIGFDDCLQLFISTGAGGAQKENEFLQFGFSPSGPDGKPQVWEWRNNEEPDEVSVPVAAQIGVHKGLNRYRIEAAISWKYLNIVPAEGKKVSLSPAVHDYGVKNVSNGTYNWFYMREDDKVVLGELTLKK
jgi:hypothetical protein